MILLINKIRRRLLFYIFKLNYFFNFKETLIKKIDKIIDNKNSNTTLKKLHELNKLHKDHPLIISQLAREHVSESEYKGFNFIKNFETVRNNWLKKKKIKANKIYIPLQQVIGALGNYYSLYYFIINNVYLLKRKIKLLLLVKETEKFTNYELFKFFRPFLKVIKNNKKFYDNYFISRVNKAPIEVGLQYQYKYYPPGIAINFINSFLYKKNLINKINFKLKKKHKLYCQKKLEKFGVKKKDWFVVLHIRENNFQNDKLRNSNPLSYIKAIKFIISRGGKVIRVGDSSMTQFPKIDGLIDYPFSELKSDKMDIYLAAECRFCIGTSSGYYSLPIFFGKPVLLVNYLNTVEYFSLRKNDLFLPKKLIDKKTKKLIHPSIVFGPKVGNFITQSAYEKNNIIVKDNTDIELLEATKEMYFLIKKKITKKINVSNKKFFKIIKKIYRDEFSINLNQFGKVSYVYLKNFYN